MEDREKAVLNGQEVQKFLHNPVIVSVFDELDRMYYDKWRAAATPEAREELWAQARALDVLVESLTAVVQAGELVNHQMERATRPAL